MKREDFVDDLIQYINISLLNNDIYKDDKINVDEAYKTSKPIVSGIYIWINDEYESIKNTPLGEENNPRFSIYVYCYAKKQKHNGTLITSRKMCYSIIDFVSEIFDRNTIKENNQNIISVRRSSSGSPMPLDYGTEIDFAVMRYEFEVIKEYKKIYKGE